MSDSVSAPLRLLLNTNVVLDFLLEREPWLSQARGLIQQHRSGAVVGYMPASVLTDIFYISRRAAGAERAFLAIDLCVRAFTLIPVDRAVIEGARGLPGDDFEDNVQIASAMQASLDYIVTRDHEGFARSPIPALTPAAMLERLGAPGGA